jgi:hypothetical protein
MAPALHDPGVTFLGEINPLLKFNMQKKRRQASLGLGEYL